MPSLLDHDPIPVLSVLALAAAIIGVATGSVAGSRSRTAEAPILAIFWADVRNAMWAWAFATGLTAVGSLARIDGLSVPIWLVLELVAGAIVVAVIRVRQRREGLDRTAPASPGSGRARRLVSTTWQFGWLGGAAGGLLIYMIVVSHAWGHPIHWLVAALGAVVGYAVGLSLKTPSYSVAG